MLNRVAICFYGQTRTDLAVDKVFRPIGGVDSFVSTWDDFTKKALFNFCNKKEFVDPNINTFINNTARSAYLINRVNKLKKDYEKEHNIDYDLVMWTRSEVDYVKNELIDTFKYLCLKSVLEKNYDKDNTIYTLNDIKSDENNNSYLSHDYTFFGSSKVFDKYAQACISDSNIENFKLSNGGHNFHAGIIESLNLKQVSLNLYSDLLFNKTKSRNIDE